MLMLDVVQVPKNDVRKIQLIPSDWLLFTNEISKENVAISGTEAPPTRVSQSEVSLKGEELK